MPDFRRSFFRPGRDRGAREREVEEEIEAHLAMRVDDLIACGMTREEAEAEARRRFGDLEVARRRLRRSGRRRDRRLGWTDAWDGLLQDVVLALREMRRSRSTTAVEWTTIAVGVALASVAFALVDQVLLRPLPFPEPESLVALYSVPESGMEDAFPFVSSENWLDWREGSRTLESTALHFRDVGRGAVQVDGVARAYGESSVTADFFEVLRPDFVVGRGFSSEEVTRDRSVVVVSEGFWASVLGAPSSLAGVTVVLDGERRDVIGVVDADQVYPEGTEIWAPRSIIRRGDAMRNNINFLAIARLRDGASAAEAQEELSARRRPSGP